MSYTRTALENIRDQSFDGKQSHFAAHVGINQPQLSKLISGQDISPASLHKICSNLPPDDSRSLAVAACRDLIPAEFIDEINLAPSESLQEPDSPYRPGPQLDDKTERIIHRLRHLAASDPETRDWLHKLSEWIFSDE